MSDPEGRKPAQSYSVRLVGSDAMHDLAVLEIILPAAGLEGSGESSEAETSSLPGPIRVGRSSELKVPH